MGLDVAEAQPSISRRKACREVVSYMVFGKHQRDAETCFQRLHYIMLYYIIRILQITPYFQLSSSIYIGVAIDYDDDNTESSRNLMLRCERDRSFWLNGN